MQLGGPPSSGQFGQVAVTGSATLAGTLQSELVGGYVPQAGDSFQVMSLRQRVRQLRGHRQPPLPRRQPLWDPVTNPTNITFTAATSVAELNMTSVNASPNPVQTGQNLTVNYTVQNNGNATAVSSWVDSVFLSTSGTIEFLGRAAGSRDPHGRRRRRRQLLGEPEGRRSPDPARELPRRRRGRQPGTGPRRRPRHHGAGHGLAGAGHRTCFDHPPAAARPRR